MLNFLKKHFGAIAIALGDVGSAFFAHFLVEKELGEGKKQLVVNEEMLRAEAPHFAKSKEDEAKFAEITSKLPLALYRILLEQWMGSLGPNQIADIIISCAELAACPRGEAPADRERALLEQLTRIASVRAITLARENRRRTLLASSMRFCKRREENYLVVKIQNQGLDFVGWLGRQAKAGGGRIITQLPILQAGIQTAVDNANTGLVQANNDLANWRARLRRG